MIYLRSPKHIAQAAETRFHFNKADEIMSSNANAAATAETASISRSSPAAQAQQPELTTTIAPDLHPDDVRY